MSRLRPVLVLGAVVVVLCLPSAVQADATFDVLFIDAPDTGFFDPTPASPVPGNAGITRGEQRRNAFLAAAQAWGGILDSPVPIRVETFMTPLPCGDTTVALGGAAVLTVFRDFPGAVRPGTWHASALADSLAGFDLGEGDPDIGAVFNVDLDLPSCGGAASWWYGAPASAPPGTFPFQQVVFHELAHGLGFSTFLDRETGEKLVGFDDGYMVHLEDHSLGADWSLLSDAERLASSVDTGDLHWTGPNVVAASGVLAAGRHPSGHVRMYAPNPAQPGSSISHFDTALSPNEVMEPFGVPGAVNLLTTELLRDLGWRARTGALAPCTPGPTVLCIDDQPGDRRFQVQVAFNSVLGGGVDGDGGAIPLSSLGVSQGGLFWFFNQRNPELLVKVINGCPVNGNHWVFYSAGTTVGFDLLVTDTFTGDTFLSANPDQTPALPVTATDAFPCGS